VSFFILASVQEPEPGPGTSRYDSRQFWLETLDRSLSTPVDLHGELFPVMAQRGMTGLGVNPSEIELVGTPGVPGSAAIGVHYPARPVGLPLLFVAEDDSQLTLWKAVQLVRDITDPARGVQHDGSFRLVCASSSGTRQLVLAYRGGLEGADEELFGVDSAVLDCVAPQPFAEDREETTREFRIASTGEPFLTSTPGTDHPWGTRRLTPSTVIGADMRIPMVSQVEFYPTVGITGPADSALITADTGMRIDVHRPIPAGKTLRIVTDPRSPSIRLDGAPAAGMLARGSRREPLHPGDNVLSVSAPGANEDTRLRLSWRGRYRGLT